jgi:DNA-binding MarR family transcriptional regulator
MSGTPVVLEEFGGTTSPANPRGAYRLRSNRVKHTASTAAASEVCVLHHHQGKASSASSRRELRFPRAPIFGTVDRQAGLPPGRGARRGPEAPMAPLKQRTGYLISQVRATMRAHLDATLADKGLTAPQYAALTTLEEDPGQSNAEMARLCFVTPQTMLLIINNLEQAGLVARTPHPTHGRVRQIGLTTRGRKLISECHQRVLALEERLVSRLSKTERKQLVSYLQRCAQALSRAD